MGRLDKKVALITGGAMGIGKACCETLAREGASVFVTDVADEEGQATAAGISKSGGEASYLHHDVSREEDWQEIVDRIQDAGNGLDILVNNAGIAIMKPLLDMTLEEFKKQNAVNLEGVFLGLKSCIPVMAESGGGSIINLSSVAGLKAAPGLAAYAMTKGGVRLLSKSVARECIDAGNNIRVNSIHPGIIETAIWDKMGAPVQPGANRVDIGDLAIATVPGGTLGKPQDIANAVLFLASDESSYVIGSELVVDHCFSA